MWTDRQRPHAGLMAAALVAWLALSGCASVPLPPIEPGAQVPAPVPPRPGEPSPPPQTPSLGFFSKIKVPEGQRPVLQLAGKGVQVFRCEQRGGEWQWIFRLPDAELVDERGAVVARHGANFSFEHQDGSRLLGRVTAFDEASSRDDLRWLLIATTSYGQGVLRGVEYVQRVNTRGGMPPARCEAAQRNQILRVDFSADFIFYRPGAG